MTRFSSELEDLAQLPLKPEYSLHETGILRSDQQLPTRPVRFALKTGRTLVGESWS